MTVVLLAFVALVQTALLLMTMRQLREERGRCKRIEQQRDQCLAGWEGSLDTLHRLGYTSAGHLNPSNTT